MKNLYIHGSFMNDNYGDYLLFERVYNICNKFSDDYYVYSSDVSSFYDNFMNFNRKSKKEAINEADVIVLAGGGYFGEPPKMKLLWNIRFLIKHALPIYKATRRKVPVCVVGLGVGPLSLYVSRLITKFIFNNAEIVCVRDQESKEFLLSCGVDRDILCFPDIMMGATKKELLGNIDYSDINSTGKIVVHLTTKCDSKTDNMFKVISDVKKIANEYGEKLVIVTDQARESQRKRAEHIREILEDSSIPIYYYNSPYELSNIISKSKMVITDKLHVGIIATRFSIPVISVAAHTKTLRFYKQIGREYCSVLLNNVKDNTVFNMYKKVISTPVLIDNFVSDSDNSMVMLEKFLTNNK